MTDEDRTNNEERSENTEMKSCEKEKFYITTPIYFPSDKLHIGHAYTTVAADTIARYKKMRGYDVFFLTGTDEHGQKIERIAAECKMAPIDYVDGVVRWIKDLWRELDIKYTDYIRTTDIKHERGVQKIFKRLYENGDIYKGEYEGKYCTPCETFFTDTQLADGKCPDCGREVEVVKEESYFFRLSKYTDRLIKHYEENPDFVKPDSRRNEMLNNFLKPGLEDLAVSRTSFKWGIPVDFDEGHVVYVWIDALSNYITALGYEAEYPEDDLAFKRYWPCDLHLMAKEIVRFHSIIWPAMLMALDIPLPKQIFGHGWIIIDGGKMSKSKGSVVDPKVLIERYGVDAIRYFLMRETVFGSDCNFSNEIMINRVNADLANDLGNLVSRTAGMVEKFFDGTLIEHNNAKTDYDDEIIKLCADTVHKAERAMDAYDLQNALIAIWELVGRLNKFIDEMEPWALAKNPENELVLAKTMYVLIEGIRIVSILIAPFMPNTPNEIYKRIHMGNTPEIDIYSWESAKKWGLAREMASCRKGEAIFPRIDVKKELEELQQQIISAQKETSRAKQETEKSENADDSSKESAPEISIDEFMKVSLKMGEVLSCERVKGSKKLLKSQVKIGGEVRQIVSGISKHYSPEEMVGKRVVVAANLKEATLAGEISQGMLLCAEDTDENGRETLALLTCEDGKNISSGANIR